MGLVAVRQDCARRLERVQLSHALPAELLKALLAQHHAGQIPGILEEVFEANVILTKGEKRMRKRET